MTVTAPRVQLRYGDKVLDSGSGGVHRHLNPYTGQLQAEIPLAGQAEVDGRRSRARLRDARPRPA